MTSIMPVVVKFSLDQVDFESINRSKGYLVPDLFADKQDPVLVLSEFFTQEIAKVGGQAVIEVDENGFSCFWNPPDNIKELPLEVQQLGIYLSHMLQAGILLDPSHVIADAAYAGYGNLLAQTLVMLNSTKCNPYVAERDMMILAMAVPMFTSIWIVLGLLTLSNKNYDLSGWAFRHILDYEPDNVTALKYLAVVQTVQEPVQAVQQAERLLLLSTAQREIPDVQMRALYGFALLSAGLVKEAAVQFKVACGKAEPKMTVQQWISWGFALPSEVLATAMRDPPHYE